MRDEILLSRQHKGHDLVQILYGEYRQGRLPSTEFKEIGSKYVAIIFKTTCTANFPITCVSGFCTWYNTIVFLLRLSSPAKIVTQKTQHLH